MIYEPKGALDPPLIMRFTTANFLDQRQAHVRPCEEPNGGDQPTDHQEREERDESDQVDEEEDEVSLLFWRHSEMVEYFYGGFSVMDAMIRDMTACFHVDMSRHDLPPRSDWSVQPREQHMPAATDDDDGVDEDADDQALVFLFLMEM